MKHVFPSSGLQSDGLTFREYVATKVFSAMLVRHPLTVTDELIERSIRVAEEFINELNKKE